MSIIKHMITFVVSFIKTTKETMLYLGKRMSFGWIRLLIFFLCVFCFVLFFFFPFSFSVVVFLFLKMCRHLWKLVMIARVFSFWFFLFVCLVCLVLRECSCFFYIYIYFIISVVTFYACFR